MSWGCDTNRNACGAAACFSSFPSSCNAVCSSFVGPQGPQGNVGVPGGTGPTGSTGPVGPTGSGGGAVIPFSGGLLPLLVGSSPTVPGFSLSNVALLGFGSSVLVPFDTLGSTPPLPNLLGILDGFAWNAPRTGVINDLVFSVRY